jgi:hypothetical protein
MKKVHPTVLTFKLSVIRTLQIFPEGKELTQQSCSFDFNVNFSPLFFEVVTQSRKLFLEALSVLVLKSLKPVFKIAWWNDIASPPSLFSLTTCLNLCCYSSVPETKKLTSVTNLFITVREAQESKITVLVGLVSGKGCSLLPRWCLVTVSSMGANLCPHRDRKAKLASVKPFYKDPHPRI